MGADDKRERIIRKFLYAKKMRFSEIETATGLRSNDLAYQLGMMIERGVLTKEDDSYVLTEESERQIPYSAPHPHPLPVVLVRVSDEKGDVLLLRRDKRPYEGFWSLPGGRLRLGETVEGAALRIAKEKGGVVVTRARPLATAVERVMNDGETKYGFVLLVVSAEKETTVPRQNEREWFSTDGLPSDTIPSDAYYASEKDPEPWKEFSMDETLFYHSAPKED